MNGFLLRFWKFLLFLNYPKKPIYPPTYPPKNPRVGRYFKKPGFFPNPGPNSWVPIFHISGPKIAALGPSQQVRKFY
jgi:hypothetical protein